MAVYIYALKNRGQARISREFLSRSQVTNYEGLDRIEWKSSAPGILLDVFFGQSRISPQHRPTYTAWKIVDRAGVFARRVQNFIYDIFPG